MSFWLNRNGHGAGFWDGDWPKHGAELDKAAHSYGEFDLYVGDDGEIDGSPLTPRRKRLNEVAEHRDPTTGQFAAGPDPVGEWAVVQRMMKVYARKAGLGDYVHNSAIPTGKPGEWRFWAQRPGERAKEHRVSQQHLKDAYERGGLSEVDERDPRTGRFVPDHHGHGHHRRIPPRRLAPQRRGASVRDYDVTDNRGRRLAGPFPDYGKARSEADKRGGVVGFVAGELRAKTRWSDAEILSSVKHGDMMTQPARERAYELVEAGLIDAAGTWKLTPAGERVLTNSGWENSADNPHRTKKVGCPVHGVSAPSSGAGYYAEASRRRATRGGRPRRPAPSRGHQQQGTVSITSVNRPDLNGSWSFTVRPYPAGDGWEWVALQNGSEAKSGGGRTKAEATEGARGYIQHIQSIAKRGARLPPELQFGAVNEGPRVDRSHRSGGRRQRSVLSRHDAKAMVAEARRQRVRSDEVDAEEAGERYAEEQLKSDHFNQWAYGQMVEGRRMRRADPKSVIPLENAADFKKLARNMLQQLGWDMDRDMDMRADPGRGRRRRRGDCAELRGRARLRQGRPRGALQAEHGQLAGERPPPGRDGAQARGARGEGRGRPQESERVARPEAPPAGVEPSPRARWSPRTGSS